MIAARRATDFVGPGMWERLLDTIDWNRVAIEAHGRHLREHPDSCTPWCGPCLKATLAAEENL